MAPPIGAFPQANDRPRLDSSGGGDLRQSWFIHVPRGALEWLPVAPGGVVGGWSSAGPERLADVGTLNTYVRRVLNTGGLGRRGGG